MKALKVLVLLVSISAASALVWNATREQKPKDVREKSAFTTEELQGSSKSRAVVGFDEIKQLDFKPVESDDLIASPKSGGIIEPEDISEIVESDKSVPKVTDEEVKRTRDMMMSTSKSGIIMSDDKIREMLEDQKKEELNQKSKPHLMPSSKSIDAILRVKDVEEIIEGSKLEKKQETPLMHSSKSFSGPLFKPKELEKIIEGEKKDPNADPVSPPVEDPFSPTEKKEK